MQQWHCPCLGEKCLGVLERGDDVVGGPIELVVVMHQPTQEKLTRSIKGSVAFQYYLMSTILYDYK